MRTFRFVFTFLALLAVAWFLLACGSDTPRQLQSITVSPTTADAQNFASGQVQFTATGNYNTDPQTVTSPSVTWGTCFQNASTSAVSVTSGGLAQCAARASGTYTIWADAPANPNVTCNAVTACGGGCNIVGTAQLTCP